MCEIGYIIARRAPLPGHVFFFSVALGFLPSLFAIYAQGTLLGLAHYTQPDARHRNLHITTAPLPTVLSS